MDSFCWAAVQHDQSAPLWLHKFFPYILLLMAILVYIPTLIWRFTAAPQLSSDLKFIMEELDRFYNRAIELAKKRASPGSRDSPESTLSVLEMTRGCLKNTLVEHYLKSKRSSRSLVMKYLACRGFTLVFLLLACAFLGYYIHLASLSNEFSCDLRTGLLQNDSMVPSAVQCKLVAVGVFGLLSKINLGIYAFFAVFVVYAVLRLTHQSSSFLRPYDILLCTGFLGEFRPCFNDLSIYLLFLKENLSHVESFKRLQVLSPLEAPPHLLGQGDSASIRQHHPSTHPSFSASPRSGRRGRSRSMEYPSFSPVSTLHDTGRATGRPTTAYCGPSSDTGSTESGQPLIGGPTPHTPGEPPRGLPEGHGRMPSPNPQNTCGLAGQTPMHPQGPC